MLASSKMPAWVPSTRYSTLSLTRVVTVTVTVDSNTVSARRWPPTLMLTSTCGASCSRNTCGALGISSDKSFR
ncbi:Uncharacterised protein [Bordetella pertussis]|nr:Uncharacterised protein [Bordetella pertussis]CPM15644.1 Uncharacterised protein [Bordetella pertussis]